MNQLSSLSGVCKISISLVDPSKPRKMRFVRAMKSPPKYKVVWADIDHAKFSRVHLEFILIDITELILN